jgi:hypothetical protein
VKNQPDLLLKNTTGGFVFDHYQNNHICGHGKADMAQLSQRDLAPREGGGGG